MCANLPNLLDLTKPYDPSTVNECLIATGGDGTSHADGWMYEDYKPLNFLYFQMYQQVFAQ